MAKADDTLLIEHEGLLYRGTDLSRPQEVWDYPRKRWVSNPSGALSGGRGKVISEARAEALKVDNPSAEHFLYYDQPPWAQPSDMTFEWTEAMKARRAEYAAELTRRGPQDPER